jgi:hypothetical protein
MIRLLMVSCLAVLAIATPVEAHYDHCSRHGDVAGINCQLAAWVHCSGGAVRATSFNAHPRRYCRNVPNGELIVATKRPICGSPITITNAKTGASIVGVVGDKGPATIAVVDLSYEAAAAIGISGSGCVYIGGAGVREAGP